MADNLPDGLIPLRDAVAEIAAIYEGKMRCPIAEANDLALGAIVRRLSLGIATAYAKQWSLQVEWKPRESWASGSDGEALAMEFWLCFEQATDFVLHDWVAGEFAFYREAEGESHGFMGFAHLLQVSRTGLPIIDDGLPLGAGDRASLAFHHANQPSALGSAIQAHTVKVVEERRGRKRKWDWEGAICAVVARANLPDGLPEGYRAQAEIGRIMADWFRDHDPNGNSPVPSEIGLRAAKIVEAIESARK